MADIIRKDESILTDNERSLLKRTFEKLEQFFPEHKVYSFDSLCSQQRENSAKLAKKLGYGSVDEFLLAYGYEPIKGAAAVYEIRKNCGIKPGEEPVIIKERVDNAINSLNEYYPDHVIEGSFNREHSNLFSKLSGFYQWLGYKSMEEMLAAYGFKYNAKAGRNKSVDPEAIIAELKKRYPEGTDLTALQIKEANPDLKIKSVMNLSKELFGMPFAKYLVEQGIVKEKKVKTAEEIEAETKASYAESLKDIDNVIQKSLLGWKPLPNSSENLLEQLGRDISKLRYKNAINTLSIDEDEHFDQLGVISVDTTDNELREMIQLLDFNAICHETGLKKGEIIIKGPKLDNIPVKKAQGTHNSGNNNDALSKTQYDYLNAIKSLSSNGIVRSVDIANHLGVSKASVSVALNKLESLGYALKNFEGSISITDKGEAALAAYTPEVDTNISIPDSIDLSDSMKSYVATIIKLAEQNKVVRAVDIANELGKSKASVSVALKQLKEKGVVTVDGGEIKVNL